MELAEIALRLQEGLRRGLDRAHHVLLGGVEEVGRFLDRLPRSASRSREEGPDLLGYLRERAALRFYPATREPERARIRELVATRFPGRLEEIAAEAERLCHHRLECLGHGAVDCGPEIDWHRDPLTGEAWARRFWADYDLVHGPGAGDPKRVCELNRHQHLPRLGKAYLVLGDEHYAREVVRQMLGWIEQNPTGVGIHWHSSLEIALRAVSWLWALFLVLPSRALDEDAARRIVCSLFAQLDHVHAYPSVASSPNTHLLGEATALFLAGLVFEDCAGGATWRDRGAEILTTEIDRQVLPDGVHAELSTWYHCYALDSYLQVLGLARRTGFGLSLRLRSRTDLMLDFLLQVTRPDGTIPRLGDDDGGRALALGATHYDRVSDLLAIGAVELQRGDLKYRAGALQEAAVWQLGVDGCRAYDRLASIRPPGLEASFPDAGYFVQRSGWDRHDSQLIFDCGGLGTLGGGHGHADALSLTLVAHGEELLVDPGTYVYNGTPAWRDGFRSTRAHNTVVIDGRDQSEPDDTFHWRRQARVELLAAVSFEDVEVVAGEHYGYVDLPDPVVHRRRVLYIRPRYWVVLDDFRGRGEHELELLYPLAPGTELRQAADAGEREARFAAVRGAAGLDLFLYASSLLTVTTHRGGDDPGLGWVSPRYGAKQPAPALVAKLAGDVPAACITVLAPRAARDGVLQVRSVPVATAGEAGPSLAVEILGDDGSVDLLVLSPGGATVTTSTFTAKGEAFFARLAGDELRRFLTIDGDGLLFEGPSSPSSIHPVAEYAPTPCRRAELDDGRPT
jgi:hypothetical protein